MQARSWMLSLAAIAALSCDRSSTPTPGVPTEAPSERASGTPAEAEPFPDEPPDELSTRMMPIGEPIKYESVTSELRPLLRANEGELLCLNRVFADENRFVADSRPECFKQHRDLWWTLYTDRGEPLATFTSVLEYSDEFDAIRVSRIIEDGKPVFGPAGNSPPYYTNIIALGDGRPYESSERLNARLHFVEGRKAILVSTTERDPLRFGIAVVDEIPTQSVETAETEIIPSSRIRWDPTRDAITFGGNDGCRFGTVKADGTEAKCRLRLPNKFFSGRSNRLRGDWYVAAGQSATDRAVALNLEDGEQLDPTDGLCGEPFFPHISSDTTVPRLLIACTGEGRRDYEHTNVWLWTPAKRVEVLGEPWRPDRSFGDYVSFRKGVGVGAADVRWLDLKRFVYWDPGALYLTEHQLATSSFPLSRSGTTELYVIDDAVPQLRPLGAVTCEGKVHITYRDDDVVSVVCTSGSEAACGVSNAMIIDHSVTWDLTKGTRHQTAGILVGVTKDTLLFNDTRHVKGGDKPCGQTVLATVAR